MFSLAKSSRIKIGSNQNCILSIAFVFVCIVSSFTCFGLYECTRADFFVTEMSIHLHVRIGVHQFPGGEVRFCGVVRDVLCSSLVFSFCPMFQLARYVCARSEILLLLTVPILFQCYFGCLSWISSLSKFTRSPLREVTRSIQYPGL